MQRNYTTTVKSVTETRFSAFAINALILLTVLVLPLPVKIALK